MAQADPHPETIEPANGKGRARARRAWPERWRWRVSLIAFLALIVFGSAIWFGRERIAGNLINDALAANDLVASYEIVSIGPQEQVIDNFVIGDPWAPDFTAERVIVSIAYSFGVPEIGRIQLIAPRLYGTYREGKFSLGVLDPILFADSEDPARLPALDVSVIDGRARIDSDFGVIGAKLEGEGRIDDGFAGKLAVTAPGIGIQGCSAGLATLYGDLAVADGALAFDGPLRLRGVACEGAAMAAADIATRLTLASDFASVQGDFDLAAEELSLAETRLAALAGNADIAWAFGAETSGEISIRHDLGGTDLEHPYARLADIRLDGTFRSVGGRADWKTGFSGGGTEIALGTEAAFADARAAANGTLLESLLTKFETGFASAVQGGRFAGDVTLRMSKNATTVIVPEARLRSADGETVMALSRLSWTSANANSPARLSGNVLTGGAGLPRINGRMEQVAGGDLALRLTMAEYRSGTDSLAIPRLELRQDRRGTLTFGGIVQASGAIPGGRIDAIELPIEGTWSGNAGLAIGRRCTNLQIAGLTLYDLALEGGSYRVCPADGGVMVRYRDRLDVRVELANLTLKGTLAGTPAQLSAAKAVLRYPGPFVVDGLSAIIGVAGNAANVSAAVLSGTIGPETGGTFTGGAAAMDVVPLDLSDLSGSWSYADDALRITAGAFTLIERIEGDARFEPLQARGATLIFKDSVITAMADLRHPASGSLITSVALRHDLSNSTGQAVLDVPGVVFSDAFQPADLSYLAKGVIVLADGTVTGEGLVEWTGDDVTSTGTFRTQGFDFAAAFGPVRALSGEVEFTDLVGLTTAPGQVLNIGSVNPGIEVLGGRIVFSMTDGEIIELEDGRWPFMGGELILRPVTINYGSGQGQRYIFEIAGLDAAAFIAQMELANLGATGIFDGTVPIAFDAKGNGTIDGGLLLSRPPGGNVAYVGELTYEDLGVISNYAFQALRSLDYTQMTIGLNGNLAGEIITNFDFDGVRQGEGTSRNFITRELAKLPIQFKVNVRSENFYLLSTVVRGFLDPTSFGNPVDQGLLRFEQGRLVPRNPNSAPAPADPQIPAIQDTTETRRDDEPPVQPPESEALR
jgi:hypothetical protein